MRHDNELSLSLFALVASNRFDSVMVWKSIKVCAVCARWRLWRNFPIHLGDARDLLDKIFVWSDKCLISTIEFWLITARHEMWWKFIKKFSQKIKTRIDDLFNNFWDSNHKFLSIFLSFNSYLEKLLQYSYSIYSTKKSSTTIIRAYLVSMISFKKREREFKWRKAVDTKAMNTNWWTLTDNVLLLHTFLLLFHSLFLYVSYNQCSMIFVCRCYSEEWDTEEQKHPVNVLREFQCHWHRQPNIQILIIKWKHVWHHATLIHTHPAHLRHCNWKQIFSSYILPS